MDGAAPLRDGSFGFAIPAADPDEPFPVEWYLAIASAARLGGRPTVYSERLPYGMWWSELRGMIELRREPPPSDARDPAGVWLTPHECISADDPRAAPIVAGLCAVGWSAGATPPVGSLRSAGSSR